MTEFCKLGVVGAIVAIVVALACFGALIWAGIFNGRVAMNLDMFSFPELARYTNSKQHCQYRMLTSASDSAVITAEGSCGSRNDTNLRYTLGTIHSFGAQDTAICGWGDIYFSTLEQRGGAFFMAPYITDLGNGSYTIWVPSDKLPTGEYYLSVWLDFKLRRDLFTSSSWFLAHQAAQQPAFLRMTKKELFELYQPVRQPIRGSGATMFVTCTMLDPFPGWLAKLAPCPARRKPFEVFQRFGAWVNCKTTIYQKGELDKICNNSGLLLPSKSFHHVYTEGACYYPLLAPRDFERCVAGVHIGFFGDSTTMGSRIEAAHMWLGYERGKNGQILSKPLGCGEPGCCLKNQTARRESYLLSELAPAQPTYRGGYLFYDVAWKKPFFVGIYNLQREDVYDRFVRQLDDMDIAIAHSCAHDLGGGWVFPMADIRPLERMQIGLRLLVQAALKWQTAGPHRRLVWVTCGYQWSVGDNRSDPLPVVIVKSNPNKITRWLSGNPVVVEAFNRLACEEMMRNGFECVDVTTANIVAQYRHEIFGMTTDIHHFEKSCPWRGVDSWNEGDHSLGHLGKFEVQHVFQQICSAARS